jgi:hypothetical protein
VIIEGEVTDGVAIAPVTSTWRYSPDDPLVVEVDFHQESEVTWTFSLELLRETLTSSGLRGLGDVLMQISGIHLVLRLNNGCATSTVKFPVDEVQDFLDRVDDRGSDEIVARELDKFLEALEID